MELQDYEIRCIEEEILNVFNDNWSKYPECDCLLTVRKDIINKRALAHQEEILPDIIAFNDSLTAALREMYDRAHLVWNSIRDNKSFGDYLELKAKCFLSCDYPALHPIQDNDRADLWCAICDSGWNPLYEDGVTLPTLTWGSTPFPHWARSSPPFKPSSADGSIRLMARWFPSPMWKQVTPGT